MAHRESFELGQGFLVPASILQRALYGSVFGYSVFLRAVIRRRVESGGARSSKHVNVDGRHAYHEKRRLGIRSPNGAQKPLTATSTKAVVESNGE